MHRVLAIGFVGALWSGAAMAADGIPTAEDYVGRWDILLFDTGTTFNSCWWKIERTEEGLGGSMVWRWGSVTPLKQAEVVAGELRVVRREGRRDVLYRAKLVGGELLGLVKKPDGRVYHFMGRPAPEMCDVAGTWELVPEGGDEDRPAKLVLEERDGKITGRGVDPFGRVHPIVRAKLEGNVLRVQVRDPEDGSIIRGRATFRGERVEAVAAASDGGEPLRLRGLRKRAWGKPVVLFDGEGLDGWGPRDPRRKFGWKVEDGAMVNSPPDVDIVSEKRFRDFRLHLEYNVDPHSNSGIYLRGRYEVQILDDHGRGVQPHGNGAVYSRLAPSKNASKPAGQWQSADITLVGRWLTVVLNGETVIDNAYLEGITGGAIDPWEGAPGPLMLQGDHGRIRFRNVVVTPAR